MSQMKLKLELKKSVKVKRVEVSTFRLLWSSASNFWGALGSEGPRNPLSTQFPNFAPEELLCEGPKGRKLSSTTTGKRHLQT